MMIVQRIMRHHGGHIAVESQIDVGTVITLQFPQQHIRTRMLESGE
jgi:signal transduction histidine kinase